SRDASAAPATVAGEPLRTSHRIFGPGRRGAAFEPGARRPAHANRTTFFGDEERVGAPSGVPSPASPAEGRLSVLPTLLHLFVLALPARAADPSPEAAGETVVVRGEGGESPAGATSAA